MLSRSVWLVAALVLAVPPCAHSSEHAYAVDPTRTRVTFEVSQLGIAKRHGVFGAVAGRVVLDAQAGDGSVDIAVNARSVEAEDASTQVFLRGRSFLNVERHSEITYTSDRVVFADGKPVLVQGTLTLLGVTRPVPLTVANYTCGGAGVNGCVLDAVAIFRRSDFGMNRYLAFVSDAVRLEIHGVAIEVSQEPGRTAAISREWAALAGERSGSGL